MKVSRITQSPAEKTSFLFLLTWVGGYCNAYTYVTRNKILANNHTGDMSKVGISLAQNNYTAAWESFILIISCVFGVFLYETLGTKLTKNYTKKDWRVWALLIESALLLIVGLLPESAPNILVTSLMSTTTGFQLAIFRKWLTASHNTTICTGNLRSLGQYLGRAAMFGGDHWKKLFTYTILLSSFIIGSYSCTAFCNINLMPATHSIWIAIIPLMVLYLWLDNYNKRAT